MILVDNIIDKLEKHKEKVYRIRELDDIEEIILHHSGTLNGRASSYARYHVKKGWPGIGYHLVGDADGCHQVNSMETISCHVSGQNHRTVGICHTGDWNRQTPTEEVYANYLFMVLFVDKKLGRSLPVRYHSDYSSKICPGKNFDKTYFEKELYEFRNIYL